MENIQYYINKSITPEELSQVFTDSGIRRPLSDLERLQAMLNNSNLIITAWCNDRLVGVARSVTDFSYCCYLSDLAVAKGYQKLGIGKFLVEKTKETIGEQVTLLLLSAPEAMEYYPKLGFEKIDNGWIIKRKY